MAKTKTEVQTQFTFLDGLKANLLLALGKLSLVIPTQPIHVIMRRQQDVLNAKENPRVLSFYKAYSEIKKHDSNKSTKDIMKALYKGTLAGTSKEFLKNFTYKGVLITGAPPLAEKMLPKQFNDYSTATQYHLIKCAFAGAIAGLSDAILGGPLERMATYMTTSQGSHSKANFFEEFNKYPTSKEKFNFVYKGFKPTFYKGTLAFSTMFSTKEPIKNWTASFYGLSPKDPAPWYSLCTTALIGGFAVALVSSPLDIIKTQEQKPGAIEAKPVLQALKDNYKLHGHRGFTTGLPAKMVMVTAGWSLNFFASQLFEERNRTEGSLPQLSSTTENKSSRPTIVCGF